MRRKRRLSALEKQIVNLNQIFLISSFHVSWTFRRQDGNLYEIFHTPDNQHLSRLMFNVFRDEYVERIMRDKDLGPSSEVRIAPVVGTVGIWELLDSQYYVHQLLSKHFLEKRNLLSSIWTVKQIDDCGLILIYNCCCCSVPRPQQMPVVLGPRLTQVDPGFIHVRHVLYHLSMNQSKLPFSSTLNV